MILSKPMTRTMKTMRNRILLAAARTTALLVLAASAAWPVQAQQKKAIIEGWGVPIPEQFARDVRWMETNYSQLPFAGTTIEFTYVTPGGSRTVPFRYGFAGYPADYFGLLPLIRSGLQPGINFMKSVSPTRMTNNFVRFDVQPGNVDWFDNTGWAQIVQNMKDAAWAAKQAGMKGIMFDPEPYTPPYAPFSYCKLPGRTNHSFAEYYDKARQRGREAMHGMVAEYPDITVHCFFLNSYQVQRGYAMPTVFGRGDPRSALEVHAYGLLAAFLDGWLDVAPSAVKIVDGNEFAYGYNSERQYMKSMHLMKNQAQDVVSSTNRARYRAQVSPGVAMYVDAYNPASSWEIELPPGMTHLQLYETNLSLALRETDEYVWLWAEAGRWWPDPGPALKPWSSYVVYPPWDTVIPGISNATRRALNPANWPPETPGLRADIALDTTRFNRLNTWGQRRVKTNAYPNLLPNPNFISQSGGMPTSWNFWQESYSAGSAAWDARAGADAGSLKMWGVGSGVTYPSAFTVSPGQKYFLSTTVWREGWGEPALIAQCRDTNNQVLYRADDGFIRDFHGGFDDPRQYSRRTNGWTTLCGVFEIPSRAVQLYTFQGAYGQPTNDAVWFDNAKLYRVGTAAEGPDLNPPFSGTSLVANSGFESGLTAWTGWQAEAGRVVEAVNDAYTGTNAARVDLGEGIVYQEVPIVASTTYDLRLYAKYLGLGTNVTVGVAFKDAGGNLIAGADRAVRVEWSYYEEYRVTGTVPTNAATLRVFGWKGTNTPGQLLLDDVFLQGTSGAVPAGFTGVARRPDGNLQLSATGGVNQVYILEGATNLTSPVFWQPVATNPATGGVLDWVDLTATNHAQRYYRARNAWWTNP
jgi:hypothetical protein